MSQLPFGLPLPQADDYVDLREWARDLVGQLQAEQTLLRSIVNGRLGFGDGSALDNLEGKWLLDQVTNGTPDTDTTYSHNIGRVPVGMLQLVKDKAGGIYKGSGAWTATTLTLRASVASVTFTGFVVAPPADF